MLQRVTIYGLHLYVHKEYIYSLKMPQCGIYLFQQEKKLQMPVDPATAKSDVPQWSKHYGNLSVILFKVLFHKTLPTASKIHHIVPSFCVIMLPDLQRQHRGHQPLFVFLSKERIGLAANMGTD
ncbi:hypothetical protein BDB00DRAFT_117772 [Zychaea mexicana]|uniref:uncharacterized protein n=1 Tax=Zychaea mexicana TaxID=64656 RepID=UPI0022FED623|nr:uncharacterized protein BDB00DRAFT_117772 [Zychaea mexicana]KAI9496406.1 hypothetical protein BDB00DRAFT_117772 [Zychaea mexicana]